MSNVTREDRESVSGWNAQFLEALAEDSVTLRCAQRGWNTERCERSEREESVDHRSWTQGQLVSPDDPTYEDDTHFRQLDNGCFEAVSPRLVKMTVEKMFYRYKEGHEWCDEPWYEFCPFLHQ